MPIFVKASRRAKAYVRSSSVIRRLKVSRNLERSARRVFDHPSSHPALIRSMNEISFQSKTQKRLAASLKEKINKGIVGRPGALNSKKRLMQRYGIK